MTAFRLRVRARESGAVSRVINCGSSLAGFSRVSCAANDDDARDVLSLVPLSCLVCVTCVLICILGSSSTRSIDDGHELGSISTRCIDDTDSR